MQVPLTVADIIADPTLDTRLLSGEAGLSRVVTWAHSCEMPDPSRWMRKGELLMTVGLSIPKGSREQREFVAALDDAGLAGMTVGDDLVAPPLTQALFDESNARGFPVLITGHSIPFIAISRMVGLANADRQTRGVLRLARLYDTSARRDAASKRSGLPLGELFDTSIRVTDDETGCVIIGEGVLANDPTRARSLRTLRPSTLSLEGDEELDSFAILHLAQVLTVDANEILQGALARVEEGAAVFGELLQGSRDAAGALQARLGQSQHGFRVIATRSENELRLPLALALANLEVAAAETRGMQVVIAPVGEVETVRSMLAELGQSAGASAVHREVGDVLGAVDEAISEFNVGLVRNEAWREFAGERVSLLARSHSEQQRIVDAVLGELTEHDSRNAVLRDTLFAFLDHNMRWNDTADALNLHRQSVVYRLERVEEVTGRSVRNTKDIAEFYLARMAWDQLQPGV